MRIEISESAAQVASTAIKTLLKLPLDATLADREQDFIRADKELDTALQDARPEVTDRWHFIPTPQHKNAYLVSIEDELGYRTEILQYDEEHGWIGLKKGESVIAWSARPRPWSPYS